MGSFLIRLILDANANSLVAIYAISAHSTSFSTVRLVFMIRSAPTFLQGRRYVSTGTFVKNLS
jgi:hypothetical protein